MVNFISICSHIYWFMFDIAFSAWFQSFNLRPLAKLVKEMLDNVPCLRALQSHLVDLNGDCA